MKTPSARNVPALLQALHQEGYTGTVEVSGSPGGTIHLRDGLIGAIETPGAPTATSTLLASGRIDDDAWLAACAAEPDADRLAAHLITAGLIGAAELEVVCTAAVFDGAFAMALSPPGGWELTERRPTLLARPGVEPRPLAEETTRRMALLARLWGPAGELARIRPRPVGGPGTPESDGRLTGRHRDLVESANGRRTPRDIAFARGRGAVRGDAGPHPAGSAPGRPLGDQAGPRQPAQHRSPGPPGTAGTGRTVTESRSPAQTQARWRLSHRRPRSEGRLVSPHKDPARKRRIRSKVARLRRRPVPRAPVDDRPVPPAETPPSAAPVPTNALRPPSTEPGGSAAERPPSGGTAAGSAPSPPTETDAPAAERPSRAGPDDVAAKPPPLPVRGAAPLPTDAADDTSDNPAVPSPFPPISLLSAEELLADQPSVDMLRRVRRGLRALPESDRHLPEGP